MTLGGAGSQLGPNVLSSQIIGLTTPILKNDISGLCMVSVDCPTKYSSTIFIVLVVCPKKSNDILLLRII